MYCKNCGKILVDGASFCTWCGVRTEVLTAAQAVSEAPALRDIPPVEDNEPTAAAAAQTSFEAYATFAENKTEQPSAFMQ